MLQKSFALALVLFAGGSHLTAQWPPQGNVLAAAQSQWKPQSFPISFWCGPPAEFVTGQHYQQIKDAGFTLIMPSCAGGSTPQGNQKILDTALAAGLRVFLSDPRMPRGVPDDATRQRIASIAAEYKDHAAFAGYFIGDEPGADAFPALAQTVAALRQVDPEHMAYLNLYPNYAPLHALGTPTYENYVQQFVLTVKPAVVSYDHYHFLGDADRPGFMRNLATVRSVAQQAGLPFWQIVLATEHFGYRRPSEAEKRFEAMQTLAHGGKGLMYFTYWNVTAEGHWGEAIIDANGVPTQQFKEVQRINRDVQTLGRFLLPARSLQVFEYGQPSDHTHTGNDVVRFEGPNLTAGVFEDGTTRYVMLANRDYRSQSICQALVDTGGEALEILNKSDGTWAAVDAPLDGNERRIPLTLAAGDADLYRWSVPSP